MRAQLLIAGVSFTGLLLLAVACGTETTYVYEDAGPAAASSGDDGTSGKGTSGSSGKSSSGDDDDTTDDDDDTPGKDGGKDGSSTTTFPTLASTKLVKGGSTNRLIGIAGDDAIYQTIPQAGEGSKVYAIPLTGGTPTEIFDLPAHSANAVVAVGTVVARWHDPLPTSSSVGSLDAWSRAAGPKLNIATNSYVGRFWASADGLRIAFMQDTELTAATTPVPQAAALVVRTLADGQNLTVIGDPADGGKVNLLAKTTCPPQVTFLKNRFVAMFCNGVLPAQDLARMVTMAPDSTTLVRVDATNLDDANTLSGKVAFSGDATGTKVVAAANDSQNGMVYTLATPQTGVLTLEAVAIAKMAPDDANVVYLTATGELKAVKPVSPLAAPVSLSTGVKALLGSGMSPNGKFVAFTKLAQDPTSRLADLNIVDVTVTPPAPAAVVADTNAGPLGFTGDSSSYVFVNGMGSTDTTTVRKLTSVANANPVPAGTKRLVPTIDAIIGGRPATEGSGFLFYTNVMAAAGGNPATADINYVDATAGSAPKFIASAVPIVGADNELFISGKRVAFTRLSGDDGIYALTLP